MANLTNKELEYIIDSMSNEDLLTKTTAQAAALSTHPEVKSVCEQMVKTHQQQYDTLLQSLQQKTSGSMH